jgi:hypothetical protein
MTTRSTTLKARSGTMAYVLDESGTEYSVSTFLCPCSDCEIELIPGNLPGTVQAQYSCPLHGTHTAAAIPCGNPAVERGEAIEISKSQAGRIFGYTEQQTRKRVLDSGVPTWGYTKDRIK